MSCLRWMELQSDPLDCADMWLSKCIPGRVCVRHLEKNMMRPATKRSEVRARELLGVILLSPDLEGVRYYQIAHDWPARLEAAGVDPETLEIIDEEKWEIRRAWFEAQGREKWERKERAKCHEQKEIRQAISEARAPWTSKGSGRSLADQMAAPDEREEDPGSLGSILKAQHRRSDVISMRDY